MIVFGSEADSYFAKFGPSYYGNTVGIVSVLPTPVQPEMTGDKTIVTDATPYTATHQYNQNTAYHATSPPTHPATATVEPNTTRTDNQIEYREKVQALHACKYKNQQPHFSLILLFYFRSSKP